MTEAVGFKFAELCGIKDLKTVGLGTLFFVSTTKFCRPSGPAGSRPKDRLQPTIHEF